MSLRGQQDPLTKVHRAPPSQTSTLSQLLSATRIPARMRLVLAMCSPGLFEHGHNRFTELAQQLRQSRD